MSLVQVAEMRVQVAEMSLLLNRSSDEGGTGGWDEAGWEWVLISILVNKEAIYNSTKT